MNYNKADFIASYGISSQLPESDRPELSFSGRSNVGKSSLINRLVNRTGLVKTSGKPGKTQSLNYFLVDEALYLVDLPGYGFARVSQQTRRAWGELISRYVETRPSLACVVVIMDLRHELKTLDRELIDWLRFHRIPFLPVYTKADKLSRNEQQKNAAVLDAGLTLTPAGRIVFSARTGQGVEELRRRLTDLAGVPAEPGPPPPPPPLTDPT